MAATTAKRKKSATKRAQDQLIRNLERALKEERLGLAAVATVAVRAAADPGALMSQLERMARLAQDNPKVPAGTREAVRHGAQIFANAIAREIGRPQQLFDPDTGHAAPDKVNAVADPETPHGGQLPLADGAPDKPLGDVEASAQDQEAALEAAQENVLRCYREHGALGDGQLVLRYAQMGLPYLPRNGIMNARKALAKSGRLVRVSTPNQKATYDLFENVHG